MEATVLMPVEQTRKTLTVAEFIKRLSSTDQNFLVKTCDDGNAVDIQQITAHGGVVYLIP
jgi:hypothetical protein